MNVIVVFASLWALALQPAPARAAAATIDQQANTPPGSYGCIVCHRENRRAFAEGVHSERGIQCHDCHGGDPAAMQLPQAHRRPFIGTPTKLETIQVCGECHSDPNRMRPFGLPADEIAELRASRHGELLFATGSPDAPTCTDCHDSHTIRPPEDSRSDVHPTNIMPTCAVCHEDEALMSKYGIPTGQARQYRDSQHGVGLYEHQNLSNPTCISCHGSHAAFPAELTQVGDVCGRCHTLVRRAFMSGPHGEPSRAGEMPGCLGCHSNHGTESIPPERILAQCLTCHDEGTEPAALGERLQAEIMQATERMGWASDASHELTALGHDLEDTDFRYRSALTDYMQLAAAQHSLDLEAVEDLGRRVRSATFDIQERAEVAEEERWEHRLLLVPVWFLALATAALAGFRLRELKVEEE
jgi:hypothetical protein